MKTDKFLCVGKIVGAHGIKGQVRVASFTSEPEALFSYKPVTDAAGERTFELVRKGVVKDLFIVALAGVVDRNEAEALRGTEFFVARALLPPEKENEYYCADFVGLAVRDAEGTALGTVEAVHDYGAGVFLDVQGATRFMLPFKKVFVPEVHADEGFLIAAVPADWIKEEKPEKKGRCPEPSEG